ncbi:hypothetical protein N7460_008001 [Penicillium canescens]|uniref:Uncharacterized protein n=1 Tax=Penicillium canescens TaxID=5083 RepID=A0AAD6IA44_PENCN|nr:hypothetical protein N7460_008001 [Penicillium canescens]
MDLEKIAVRTAMVLSISYAALTGSPIGEALIQTGSGSYLCTQCFATVIMRVGTIVPARWQSEQHGIIVVCER